MKKKQVVNINQPISTNGFILGGNPGATLYLKTYKFLEV